MHLLTPKDGEAEKMTIVIDRHGGKEARVSMH